MKPVEINNLKLLGSYIASLCLNINDYTYIHHNGKEVGYSPFGSDMMVSVIKRGCLGRFYCGDHVWLGYCFVEKSVKLGHFKFLWSDPDQAVWGERKWSDNINLSDTDLVKQAIKMNDKIEQLKAFW